ncbi:hypothetical protein ACLOJK_036026 [Asimina triloba]
MSPSISKSIPCSCVSSLLENCRSTVADITSLTINQQILSEPADFGCDGLHMDPISAEDNDLEKETSSDDASECAPQKLTRAQRKRIRKKKLKEAASRRRKIIGPLLPTHEDIQNETVQQNNWEDGLVLQGSGARMIYIHCCIPVLSSCMKRRFDFYQGLHGDAMPKGWFAGFRSDYVWSPSLKNLKLCTASGTPDPSVAKKIKGTQKLEKFRFIQNHARATQLVQVATHRNKKISSLSGQQQQPADTEIFFDRKNGVMLEATILLQGAGIHLVAFTQRNPQMLGGSQQPDCPNTTTVTEKKKRKVEDIQDSLEGDSGTVMKRRKMHGNKDYLNWGQSFPSEIFVFHSNRFICEDSADFSESNAVLQKFPDSL